MAPKLLPHRSLARIVILSLLVPLLGACGGSYQGAPGVPSRAEAGDIVRARSAPIAPEPPSLPPVETPADAPPTWATIYARYLGPGTDGACGRTHCHAGDLPDADSVYRWLSQRGYIAGRDSPLVARNSCLRWFGGNMPPAGSPNERAMRDLSAWAAAGAQDN